MSTTIDVLDVEHQRKWDSYAQSYDRILPLMPYYQEVLHRHLAALVSAGDGPLIDLGAGTGCLVELLLAAGRCVTAVDNSRSMLHRLRSKPALAAELGQRLNVIESTAESLPMLADQSFVGVSLQLAVFDMLNPVEGLRTALRILQDGGCIVITDLKRCFQLAPIFEACQRQLHALDRYDELAEDLARVVRSNEALAPGTRSSMRIEDIFDFLVDEGCQEASFADSHFGQCATVIARKPRPSQGPRNIPR